jgi:DNA ligase 1
MKRSNSIRISCNESTDEFHPFQKLMQKRRKYEVEKYIEILPVAVFFFDILLLEGIVIKSMENDSFYEAGKRSWLWLKWKEEYAEGMRETFTKVGTGFTDEDAKEIDSLLSGHFH